MSSDLVIEQPFENIAVALKCKNIQNESEGGAPVQSAAVPLQSNRAEQKSTNRFRPCSATSLC